VMELPVHTFSDRTRSKVAAIHSALVQYVTTTAGRLPIGKNYRAQPVTSQPQGVPFSVSLSRFDGFSGTDVHRTPRIAQLHTCDRSIALRATPRMHSTCAGPHASKSPGSPNRGPLPHHFTKLEWSPKWSPTPRHQPTSAGTRRDRQTKFIRQFNTSWDRTNRDNTGTTKFQDRCLKPLGHPSRSMLSTP
jgi:hypothetical protein